LPESQDAKASVTSNTVKQRVNIVTR
jgi:hypothetical protein